MSPALVHHCCSTGHLFLLSLLRHSAVRGAFLLESACFLFANPNRERRCLCHRLGLRRMHTVLNRRAFLHEFSCHAMHPCAFCCRHISRARTLAGRQSLCLRRADQRLDQLFWLGVVRVPLYARFRSGFRPVARLRHLELDSSRLLGTVVFVCFLHNFASLSLVRAETLMGNRHHRQENSSNSAQEAGIRSGSSPTEHGECLSWVSDLLSCVGCLCCRLGWGGLNSEARVPKRAFTQVCGGWYYSCGLIAPNNTIVCFGVSSFIPANIPATMQFSSISCGWYVNQAISSNFLCGIRLNTNELMCFGNGYSTPLGPSIGQLAPTSFYRTGTQTKPCSNGVHSNGAGSVVSLCSGPCSNGLYANSTLPPRADCSLSCPQGIFVCCFDRSSFHVQAVSATSDKAQSSALPVCAVLFCFVT